jgi:hypothetical protein
MMFVVGPVFAPTFTAAGGMLHEWWRGWNADSPADIDYNKAGMWLSYTWQDCTQACKCLNGGS